MNNEIKNCLICESERLTELTRYKKDHLTKCQDCSFVFSSLNPSQEELNQVYSGYQRGKSHPTSISLEKYQKRARQIMAIRPLDRVLDVGCGDGHFLKCFHDAGVKTYGTEFDIASGAIAEKQGATMLQGGLTPELPDDILGFDAIIFTEVIEHINKPIDVLGYFYKLLNSGGLIFITTPNFQSIERYILGPSWGMIMYPEHISYYSPRTLDNALINVGFKKITVQTENISVFRVVQFLRKKLSSEKVNLNPENISAVAQEFANKHTVGLAVKNSLNYFFQATGTGSSLVAIYQKPIK